MTSPAVSLRSVSKHFGTTRALDDLSMDVPQGGVTGLLGPSGSGKTTALRVIAGFDRPDTGTVTIAGTDMAAPDVWVPPERRRVGMVFQDYALFPHLTVAENVGFGLRRGDHSDRIDSVLELVGLGGFGARMPHELSGGEQQRVALARALAPEPHLVLLDEPFSNLDAPIRDRIRRDIRTILVEARATAVFVTHDQEEALAMSDTVAVIRDGTVVQTADPHELYTRPSDCWVARFLGDAGFVDGHARDGRVETPIGVFGDESGTSGPVEVMVRPESVRLTPKGTAVVVEREFYGHDQLVTLRLGDGHRLLARTGPAPIYRPGDEVGVEIDDVVVFPHHSEHPAH